MSYRIKHTMVDFNHEGDIVDDEVFAGKDVDRLIRLGAIEKTSDKPTHDGKSVLLTAAAEAEKRDRAEVGLDDGEKVVSRRVVDTNPPTVEKVKPVGESKR